MTGDGPGPATNGIDLPGASAQLTVVAGGDCSGAGISAGAL